MPSDVILDSEYLWCRKGTSDKVYNIYVKGSRNSEMQGLYDCSVMVEYGRRGSTLKQEVKCTGKYYAAAKRMFDKLVAEKTSDKKGYRRANVAPVYQLPTVEPIMDIEDALQPNKVVKFREAKKEKPAKPQPPPEINVETERKLRFGKL